jgi:hypothetical protein
VTGVAATATAVAVVHLVTTLMMAGLIVFVQVVHYPLKARVGAEAFPGYQTGHTVRTSWVVVPLMLVELVSALWLAAMPPTATLRPVALLGALLLGGIWVSTALLQAPAHGRLARGFDAAVHRRLVRSNWIRTLAWLGRVPVALALALPAA